MRTLLWFSLIGLVALGAVFVAAPRMADAERASAMIAAASICLSAGLIAMVPAAVVAPRWPDYIMQAGMGAMVIRLFLTLGVGMLYLKWYTPPTSTFMTAMVVCYLLLLAVETGVTLRLVKRYWHPPHSV